MAHLTIVGLRRYPVKSLGGEALETVSLERGAGMAFDRRYAFIERAGARAGKPLTAREAPGMFAHRARVEGEETVIEGDGGMRSVDEFARESAQRFGREVEVREDRGFANQDAAEILVVVRPTLRAMEAEFGARLDIRRFRPNIVLDGVDAEAFDELSWIGSSFRAGGATLRAVGRCVRCAVPTIDPDTMQIDPSILRFLVERHDTVMGTYCAVEQGGSVSVGDVWEAAG